MEEVRNGKTLCFTGKRPKDLCGYKKDKYEGLTSCIKRLCETYYKSGYTRYLFGGAQGFDQIAFWAVYELKKVHQDIKLIVYVPFKGQERKWLETGLFSQQEYQQLLSLADEVVYLHEKLENYNDIVKALYERNHAMVTNSDAVIALYPDATWKTNKSGTAECMRYADKHHKEICQIRYSIENDRIVIDGAYTNLGV